MALKTVKRINDNVYGSINITEQELRIIDTPVFQRLRYIKQLGATDFVYPGATNTRIAHSIGTMHMIGQFISGAKKGENGLEMTAEDEERLRLAALLHDVGHYPYSHTTENVIVRELGGKRHELFGEHLLKSFFAEQLENYTPSEISNIFTGKERSIGSLLISSALDADKADYLMRDSYHTGVPYGRVSLQRLIRTISYVKGGIAFEKDEVAVEDFLIGRYHMYRAVYHHKAVVAFNLMVERMFRMLVEEGYIIHPNELFKTGDPFLISSYTDSMLHSAMQEYLKSGKDPLLLELIRNFVSREPLEPVYLNPTPVRKGQRSRSLEAVAELSRDGRKLERLAKDSGVEVQELFPTVLRPLSLIDEDTRIFIKSKGRLKPITESGGLVLDLVGSSTLHDARLYAMPGRSKRIIKALDGYLN